MSRFKIIIFLFTLSIAGSIVATAYWFYRNVLGHDNALVSEIKEMQNKKTDLPDPGIRRFEKAAELLESGNLMEGRKALYDLLRTFPNSNRAPEAKRIIGEINLDLLFSEDNPQRKKYTVQTGDSVGLIARKQNTTIECLMRANGLFHHNLHPGDHLYVFPLEFEVVVEASSKTLTLLRNGSFFKEYHAVDVRLPPSIKAPAELVISGRAAWSGGKLVQFNQPQFFAADKWLMGNRKGSTTGGINIRPVPLAKPVALQNGEKNKSEFDDLDNAPEPGIFLLREDVEELFTITRAGTVLKILR